MPAPSLPVVLEARSGHVEDGMPESKKPNTFPSQQLEPGTLLLDRYSIVHRVGGGGMGSVYQARDKRLADRLCAVKEMIEMFADSEPARQGGRRLQTRSRSPRSTRSPFDPTVFDYFIENRQVLPGDALDRRR